MRLRHLITTLWFGIFCLMISNVSFAEELRCEQDFPKIKRMLSQEKNIHDRGSFDELLKFYQRTEYSELFIKNHPGQKFLYNEWVSDESYQSALKESFDSFRPLRVHYRFKFSKPQQNFILDDQELCIFDMKILINIELDEPLTDESTIVVRKRGSTDWRVLAINHEIKEQDFREFFPNFPKNIAIRELPYTH